MRFTSMLAVAALFLATTAASAATVNSYRCNSCAASDYRIVAINKRQVGIRFVYDWPNHQYHKFQVTSEPAAGGTLTYFADELSLTSDEQAYFAAENNVIDGLGGLRPQAVVTLPVTASTPGWPISSNPSVYGLMSNSGQLGQIANWIQGVGINPGTDNTFSQVVNAILDLVRKTSGGIVLDADDTASITITFTFTNGHKITFTWKKGDAAPVDTEARDSSNNLVTHGPPGDGSISNFNGRSGGSDMNDFHNRNNLFHFLWDNVCNHPTIAIVVLPDGTRSMSAVPRCD